MDFHSLSRRKLQALCKRNNIPANLTNAAMADSLKSLVNVEGIDELLQVYESETAQIQSSTESGMRMEVTSPFVPLTGSRSTRRRNAETPVAPQSKMDDCAQKNPLLTPAPLGVMSRRRRAVVKDSAVKSVCATRRSARLAEKSARLLKEVADGNPDFSKKGLFTDDCHEELKVNLKESLDDLDEISVVTDLSESTYLEENSERKDDEQVYSAEKQDIATDVEENRNRSVNEGGSKTDVKEHIEEKDHVEVVPCEKEVLSAGEEVDLVPKTQEKKGYQDEGESEQKEYSFVEINERGAGSENLDLPVVDAITILAENSEQKPHEEVDPCESVLTVQEENSNDSEADDDAETETEDINVSEIDSEFDDVQASETNIGVEDTISEDASAVAERACSIAIYECSVCSTPIHRIEASSTLKETMVAAIASDNKEKICSKSKTRIEIVGRENTEADVMGQLSRMFKEVCVTPKLDKIESENEVTTRSALQVLPHNQKMN